MQVRTDIKTKLKELGKSAADLSRGINLNYEILNRYLNGRAPMPEAIESKIKKVLDEWGF